MKHLFVALALISTPVLSANELSPERASELEDMLISVASKLIYVDRDCGMPIDGSKFIDLAKIKAFSEGFYTMKGIDTERIKVEANRAYGELKVKAPVGELCEEYAEKLADSYQWLKDSGHKNN